MSFKLENHREVTQITTFEDIALGIMRWGTNNSFPQTLVNLIRQSPNAKPAVSRTAKFIKGGKFEGEDTIVSPYGLTLKKVVSIMAEDYAIFNAFAIHCNYNLEGQVVSINPMRIAELRFNRFDELNYSSKIGYHSNFGLNSEVKKTIVQTVTKRKIKWFDRFNPNVVKAQIQALGKAKKGAEELSEIATMLKGIGKYKGQMLYHTDSGHSNYPIPPLQAPVNFVLSDVENSILVRKETATGFISSYLLKTMMDAEDPNLIALENSIIDAQGARGTGKVITMPGLSQEEMTGTTLEEIGGGAGARTSIIDSAKKAYDLDREVILGAYLIPPILAGVDVSKGLSTADLSEAYFVFNTQTQDARDIVESELNRILAVSVFKTKSIEINKLILDIEQEDENDKDKKFDKDGKEIKEAVKDKKDNKNV